MGTVVGYLAPLLGLALWVALLGGAAWALATLARLRRGQAAILARLAALEAAVAARERPGP